MGSSSSTPIKQAEKVESDQHNNLVELRFDHLAVGGTAIMIIFAAIVAYCCMKRKKAKSSSTQLATPTPTPHGACIPPGNTMSGGFNVPILFHVGTEEVMMLASLIKKSPKRQRPSRSTFIDVEQETSTDLPEEADTKTYYKKTAPNTRPWDQ